MNWLNVIKTRNCLRIAWLYSIVQGLLSQLSSTCWRQSPILFLFPSLPTPFTRNHSPSSSYSHHFISLSPYLPSFPLHPYPTVSSPSCLSFPSYIPSFSFPPLRSSLPLCPTMESGERCQLSSGFGCSTTAKQLSAYFIIFIHHNNGR